MNKYREIIKRPIITEKSLSLAQTQNCYTFEVAQEASKGAVGKAVEKIFGVSVLRVRTSTIPSKKKHNWKFRTVSQRSPWKKAMVELEEGDKIEGFEAGQ